MYRINFIWPNATKAANRIDGKISEKVFSLSPCFPSSIIHGVMDARVNKRDFLVGFP